MDIATPLRAHHTPCINVCVLDERSGFCLGCARTIDEIAAWSSLNDAARDAIWNRLPDRLAALSECAGQVPPTSDAP